jgi:hypothetical protein
MHASKQFVLFSVCLLLRAASPAAGAVFYTETFSSGSAGWTSRDPFEMANAYSAGFGDPAGSLQGTFNSQGIFVTPETDAFRASGAGDTANFMGDYSAPAVAGYTGWTFDFYATNVLPSDISIRFGDGTNTFSYAAIWQVPTTGAWHTVKVPLTYSASWFGGGGEAGFSNALTSVNFIDVQITRSGGGTQRYYIDNFALVNELLFVPEPTSGLFWFGWALVFGGLRRKLAIRRNRSPYSLPAVAR